VPIVIENDYTPWSRWFFVKAQPAADGGLAVYFQDITRRKEAEQPLRDRTALLEAVSDTTSELIFAKDREARVTSIPRFARC
jgi:PAS domain-containing protein